MSKAEEKAKKIINSGLKKSASTPVKAKSQGGGETPPAVLVSWLIREAENRGMQMRELASALGVTYGYIAQLRNGTRLASRAGMEFISKAAEFLGTPKVTVMVAAEMLTPADFYTGTDYKQEIQRAVRFISTDPEWGALVPKDLEDQGIDVQQFVVLAYEKATGRVLLRKKKPPEHILEEVQELRKQLRQEGYLDS